MKLHLSIRRSELAGNALVFSRIYGENRYLRKLRKGKALVSPGYRQTAYIDSLCGNHNVYKYHELYACVSRLTLLWLAFTITSVLIVKCVHMAATVPTSYIAELKTNSIWIKSFHDQNSTAFKFSVPRGPAPPYCKTYFSSVRIASATPIFDRVYSVDRELWSASVSGAHVRSVRQSRTSKSFRLELRMRNWLMQLSGCVLMLLLTYRDCKVRQSAA